MLDLKMIPSVLLAASLAITATTAAGATPPIAITATITADAPKTTSHPGWTYWQADAYAINFQGCATEYARMHGAGRDYLLRTRSDAPCARNMYGLEGGHDEVVLFKQEEVQGAAVKTEGSWKDRALAALTPELPGLSTAEAETSGSGQVAFHLSSATAPPSQLAPQVITINPNSLLVALTEQALSTIDQRATFDTRLERLVFRPFSTLADDEIEKPEPSFKRPKYNSVVAKIASSSALNPARIIKDLRILTGEDVQPADVGEWHSRHSSTYGARRAGSWIKQQLEQSLSPLNGSSCDFFEYSPYFAPNVVCQIPASGEEASVIVSAHYDSRGTFGSTTAPGGDDDGSGTAALLAIARSIGASQLRFSSPIQLVAFSGEEQGLVGSKHYAAHLRSRSARIKLAVQMDMLAYRKPGEELQIAFPDRFVTNSATQHLRKVADIYAPELQQGYTPACCSDHQSFWENGFPATWVFERNGPIADPMYHDSGDTTDREGYSLEQLASIAKVVLASVLDVAGFEM